MELDLPARSIAKKYVEKFEVSFGIYSSFPHFGNLLITVLAFILCLSVIVFVHEFGHFSLEN